MMKAGVLSLLPMLAAGQQPAVNLPVGPGGAPVPVCPMGTTHISATQCMPCPAGMTTAGPGAIACVCPKDYIPNATDVTGNSCVKCPDPFVTGGLGQAQCVCPVGKIHDPATMWSTCTDCPQGYTTIAPGSGDYPTFIDPNQTIPGCDFLIPCAIGTYHNATNFGQCLTCPAGQTTATTGSFSCVCDTNFFYHGLYQTCVPCATSDGKPLFTNGIGATDYSQCGCPKNTYPNWQPDATAGAAMGYMRFDGCTDRYCGNGGAKQNDAAYIMFVMSVNGTVDTVTDYNDEGFDCPGGNIYEESSFVPKIRAGYWLSPKDPAGPAGLYSMHYKCLHPMICPGGGADQCGLGHSGTACVWCAKGSHPDNDGICQPCGDTGSVVFGVSVVAGAVLMLIAYKMWNLSQSSGLRGIAAALSVGGFAVQCVPVLGAFAVQYQEPMKSLVNLLNIFQFEFDPIRVQCVVDATADENSRVMFYFMKLVVPTLAFMLVATVSVVSNKVSGESISWSRILNCMGATFSFFFPALVLIGTEAFRCGGSHPFGLPYVDGKPDLICTLDNFFPAAEQYQWYMGVGCFLLAILIMYTAVVLWATLVHSSKVAAEDKAFMNATKFLFARWKNEKAHWALLWHLRSAVMGLIPLFTLGKWAEDNSSAGSFQLVLFVAVLALWSSEVGSQNPWRFCRVSHLDRTVNVMVAVLAVASSYNLFASVQNLSYMAFAVAAAATVMFLGYDVYKMKTSKSDDVTDYAWMEEDTKGLPA